MKFELGARTAEGKYTSPILCIHLQRHSRHNTDTARNTHAVLIQNQNAHEMQNRKFFLDIQSVKTVVIDAVTVYAGICAVV